MSDRKESHIDLVLDSLQNIHAQVRELGEARILERFDALLDEAITLAEGSLSRDAWTGIAGIAIETTLIAQRLGFRDGPIVFKFANTPMEEGVLRVGLVVSRPPGSGSETHLPRASVAMGDGAPPRYIDIELLPDAVNRFVLNLRRWKDAARGRELRDCSGRLDDDLADQFALWVNDDRLRDAARVGCRRLVLRPESTAKAEATHVAQQSSVAKSGEADSSLNEGHARFTYQQLGNKVNLSRDTLRRYGKKAGLTMPGPSQHGWTFSIDDARAIASEHLKRNPNHREYWDAFFEECGG